MEITIRTSSHVLKIGFSLNQGATNKEAEAWLQEHATKNDFHEKMAMRRKNNGGIIGRVEHIDERKVATELQVLNFRRRRGGRRQAAGVSTGTI